MPSYPGGIYNPTNPTATSPRNNPSLSGEITGLNNEIVAIETTLGINLGNIAASVGAWPGVNGSGSGHLQATTASVDSVGYKMTERGSGGINLASLGTGSFVARTNSASVTVTGASVQISPALGVNTLPSSTPGTIATAPPSSASVATPTIGLPFQNSLGYDAQFIVTIAVTAATSATMNVGVNSASVSTAQPLLTSFTTAAFVPVIVPLLIPASYYGVIKTGGTITAAVDSCIAMPI